jgi:hypothetical protein
MNGFFLVPQLHMKAFFFYLVILVTTALADVSPSLSTKNPFHTDNETAKVSEIYPDSANEKISNPIADMVNSEILTQAGVQTARGLGIHLGELTNMNPAQKMAAVDEAITRIQKISRIQSPHRPKPRLTYKDYFIYMIAHLAKSAAVYQALGFTQEGLNENRVTLLSEVTNLDRGYFQKANPQARYQTLIFQNMLYGSHSFIHGKEPIERDRGEVYLHDRTSLFAAIKSFSPETAEEIEKLNPVRMFWNYYENYFKKFDVKRFEDQVLGPLMASRGSRNSEPPSQGREAPTGSKNFFRSFAVNATPDFSQRIDPGSPYLRPNPDLEEIRKALAPHPEPLAAGKKIIWMTENGLSPSAVITDVSGDSFEIAYQHPAAYQVIHAKVTRDEILKLNNPRKLFKSGTVIFNTSLEPGPKLRPAIDFLKSELSPVIPDFERHSPIEIRNRQFKALNAAAAALNVEFIGKAEPREKDAYYELVRSRLKKERYISIEQATLECSVGNCVDTSLTRALILDSVAKDFRIEFSIYKAKLKPVMRDGADHWLIIATLWPSQEQYVIDRSPLGSVMALNSSEAKIHFLKFPEVHSQVEPKAPPSCDGMMQMKSGAE